MRSVRSTVERRSGPTVGAVFSAMKAEYVVVAEQAHSLLKHAQYNLHMNNTCQ